MSATFHTGKVTAATLHAARARREARGAACSRCDCCCCVAVPRSCRDLKPENILLKKIVHHVPGEAEPSVRWLAKISDFGVSRVVSDMGCQTMAGTPQYLAPEIIRSANGGGSAYDHRVDMWSLGVILYILLAGTQPFSDTPAMSVMDQILNGRYEFPARKWGHISREGVCRVCGAACASRVCTSV